ncbi:MAG: NAD(+) synthase [Clostridiaceae bacterium]|nr:NAD(+) synthase [Clostridiaceae bacterium]
MHYGFIKAAAASPSLKVADCRYNCDNIIKTIEKAYKKGVKLLVFPELSITGYTCDDLFSQKLLLDQALIGLMNIVKESKDRELLIVTGLPIETQGYLYNCAAVVYNGEILGIVPKTHLPNYNEFYESRRFKSAPKDNFTVDINGKTVPFGTKLIFQNMQMKGFSLAIEICEDLFVPVSPGSLHAMNGAAVIANLSASNEILGKGDYRRTLIKAQSGKSICAYIYSNSSDQESTTDMVFSGHKMIAENGVILNEASPFTNEYIEADIDLERLEHDRMNQASSREQDMDNGYQIIPFSMKMINTKISRVIEKHPFIPKDTHILMERCNQIFSIQTAGLKKRIEHSNSKTAVIGISGGLDSTLALLVTHRAFMEMGRDASDIVCVSMPCFGTTKRTKDNARKLSRLLNVDFRVIDISMSVKRHLSDIGHDGTTTDTTYENAQARERTQVLMDISNMTNGMVIGTGDLSEQALGWSTYNGDHMSMYNVNTSIPKTLVKYIVRYVADDSKGKLRDVLYDILDTPISPELIPALNGQITQKTESIVGPYELHDFFLYNFMRWGFTPKKILMLASHAFKDDYPAEEINKWLKIFIRRFFTQQFKRSCSPNGPKVGSVALSPRGDWRMPSDASYEGWMNDLD